MDSLRDINKEEWEVRKPKYDKLYRPEGRYQIAVGQLVLHQPQKWLDIGAGNGYLATLARAELADVHITGVDFVPNVMDGAKELDERILLNLDEAPLPLPDESLDYVTCLEVLEHLILPDNALQEIYRVLKPGGHVLLSVPNLQFIEYLLAWLKGKVPPPAADPRHMSVFTIKFLTKKLKSAKFSVTQVSGCDASPSWLARISRPYLCKTIIVEARK